jgi:RHS repeat-associated protein
VVQRFGYDAYGNHLLAAGSAPASAADAITDLLHSGEATDPRKLRNPASPTGRQYLRARGYDPTTGRFNRLDPFAGLAHEPQSLHKYLYAHADPIMGVDPTGRAVSAAIGVGLTASGMYDTAMSIKDLATRVAAGAELRGALLKVAIDAALSVGAGKAFGLAAKGLNV